MARRAPTPRAELSTCQGANSKAVGPPAGRGGAQRDARTCSVA
eukprot:CAMPEP_0198603164 /NCGR_PEP_ID=MMETSP1462-20131121/151625_1 /TAXON_ID=1333877 /ORGANISM="Brandtodinium nutriculum, Strain RCC3387" /LENGTH=42 /DNA_ID= /DNA_START= /DNA_END= /DNA_ORIENTATION=